jgi:hypothetical protein
MQKKRKKEILGILDEIGIKDAVLSETNSSHIRITYDYHGQTVTYVTGGSPSDWRVNLKMKCDLKRMMREIDAGRLTNSA